VPPDLYCGSSFWVSPDAVREKALQVTGRWKRSDDDDDDNMEITLDDAGVLQLIWDEKYTYPPSTLTIFPGGIVEMELGGAVHTGTLEPGPPQLLRWADGEVFTQVPKPISILQKMQRT